MVPKIHCVFLVGDAFLAAEEPLEPPAMEGPLL